MVFRLSLGFIPLPQNKQTNSKAINAREKKGTHWRIIRGETHVPVKMRALRKRRKMQVESLWRHEIPWVPRVLGGYCP